MADKYSVLTKDGPAIMTADEIVLLAYSIIDAILAEHYAPYKRYWEDWRQDAVWGAYQTLKRYNPARGRLEPFLWGAAKRVISKQVRTQVRYDARVEELPETVTNLMATPYDEPRPPDPRIGSLREFIQAKGRGTLTSQERKAVRLKIEGKTNVEIYNELFRPEPYKSHIGVAMVAYWRRLGIKYEKWREKHGK